MYLDFDAPIKGVKVDLARGGCGIRYVNMLDFIASVRPARVSRSQKEVTLPTVSVRFDGWVFPRSGVAFGWVLERVMVVPVRSRV